MGKKRHMVVKTKCDSFGLKNESLKALLFIRKITALKIERTVSNCFNYRFTYTEIM